MQASVDEQNLMKNELGMVICKVCNEVMYTLPTNGVRKLPGICAKAECVEQSIKK